MTLEEYVGKMREKREREAAMTCRCGCGQPLDVDDIDSCLKIDGQIVRADCWFAAIGTLIEQHPICTPGIRGRGVNAHHGEVSPP
jgi:hypothetical protein